MEAKFRLETLSKKLKMEGKFYKKSGSQICMLSFTATLHSTQRSRQSRYPLMDERINKVRGTHNTLFSLKKGRRF